MRTLTVVKKAFITAIIFFFSCVGFIWAQAQTEAEKALERKLEEKQGKKKKTKKTKISAKTPAIDPTDTTVSVRERAINIRAREIELREELKKLEDAKRKLATPAEKKAEKEIVSAEKRQASADKRMQEVRRFAKVTGCPSGTVTVSPNAVPAGWRLRWGVVVVVDITNSGAMPVDEIRAGNYGLIVQNLCSGGSVSVAFTLYETDSDQKEIILTATSRPPDGGVATAEMRACLNRQDIQYRRLRNEVWRINLQRQYQTR